MSISVKDISQVYDGIRYTRHKAWMFSGWYVRELRLAISSIISSWLQPNFSDRYFWNHKKYCQFFFNLIYRVVIIRDTPLNAFLTKVLLQIEVVYNFSEILTKKHCQTEVQLKAYLYFQNPSRSQSLNDKMINVFHQLFYPSHINVTMWKKKWILKTLLINKK